MNRVKIKNCCKLIDYRGKTPEKSEDGYILITAKNVKDDGFSFEPREYIPKENYDTIMVRGFPESGDVLFTTEAPLGNVCRIPEMNEPFAVGQRIVVIRPKRDVLRRDYLEHALKSRRFRDDMWKRSSGSTVKGIRTKELIEIEIPIPDVNKQRIIAESLDKLSVIINARKQQLGELDNLIKSRFVELFGDPNINEMGWIIGVINDIGTCVAGATPSTKVDEYWKNGTIPWMSSGEVNKGRVFETDTMISQLGYDNASTKLVPAKTVVLAMAGQGKTRGMAAITEIELCTNQSICSIVNNEKVDAEYLLYFLNLQYKELRGASTNTDGRGGLNLKIIGNYPIMIPPIELQKQFADFVKQVDKFKFDVQKSLSEMQLLFDTLMQKYFG